MENEFVKFGRLASRLQLPKAYLRRLVESEKIPFLDMGHGRLLFNEAEVRKALANLAGNNGQAASSDSLALATKLATVERAIA